MYQHQSSRTVVRGSTSSTLMTLNSSAKAMAVESLSTDSSFVKFTKDSLSRCFIRSEPITGNCWFVKKLSGLWRCMSRKQGNNILKKYIFREKVFQMINICFIYYKMS